MEPFKIKLYTIGALLVVIVVLALNLALNPHTAEAPVVSDFASCTEAGYAILESYPERCVDGNGNSYTNPAQSIQTKQADVGPDMNEDEARIAAINSTECTQRGALGVFEGYNPLQDAWVYTIDANDPSCNSACIVDDTTGNATVDERCTE